jgi:hypothetical protein
VRHLTLSSGEWVPRIEELVVGTVCVAISALTTNARAIGRAVPQCRDWQVISDLKVIGVLAGEGDDGCGVWPDRALGLLQRAPRSSCPVGEGEGYEVMNQSAGWPDATVSPPGTSNS